EGAMVGKVGRDGFADVALSELRAGGVDITRVERDEHPTGCPLICVDSSGQNQIVLATGANATALERQVPDEWLTPATVVLMQMEVWPAENWALGARASARARRGGPAEARAGRADPWHRARGPRLADRQRDGSGGSRCRPRARTIGSAR